jgi:hypothetical protein
MHSHLIVVGLLAGLLLMGRSHAQGLPSPEEAMQNRQIRGLEQRSLGGSLRGNDVQQQQRSLLRSPDNLYSSPQGRILERQLDAVRQSPNAQQPRQLLPPSVSPALPSTLPLQPEGLPDTYTDPDSLLPSQDAARGTAPGGSSDTVTTASRLLLRAEHSLAAGDPARARSDIDFAERLLAGFDRVQPGDAAYPRLATARQRLNVLRDQLAASTKQPPFTRP